MDALNIIKNFVNDDNQFTKKMTIPQDKFLDVVNLVLIPSFTNKLMS